MRRSTKTFPSRSGAHCGATAQVMCEPGKLCFRLATAGSVWMMSPIAPSRTTSIRTAGLGSLTPVYMFDQGLRALPIGALFANHFVGLNLFQRQCEVRAVQQKYVVYHAERGGKLGAG